jgi:hypothetical protein
MSIRPQTLKWLKEIPPGEYTLIQLVLLTKRDKSNIHRVFKQLNVEKRTGKIISNNMVEIIYIWRGVQ